MGRPACSSCCKETPSKKGCRNDDFSVYYQISGGGGWISSSKYAEYLLSQYNLAQPDGDQIYKAGFIDMSEIYYRITKKDYGEYQTSLNCWNYPAVFLTQDLFDRLKDPNDDKVPALINEEFQKGNEDIGMHMPTSWQIGLGDEPESWLWVTRELVGLDTYDELVAGRDFGFPDGRDHDGYVDGSHCKSTNSRSWELPGLAAWSDYLGEIEEMDCPVEGRHPEINDGDDAPCITHVQVKVTHHLVKWCTKIYTQEKDEANAAGRRLKYDEVDSLTWKKEYTLLNQGEPIDNIEPLEEKLLEFDGEKYTMSNDFDAYGQQQSSALRRDVLEPYTDFDYCSTYPFFSFIHYTGLWNPWWGFDDIRPRACLGDGECPPPNSNDPFPKGTIEMYVPTEQGYNADKGLFTSIGVITPRSSVVFNPYTESLGRGITDDEFSHYDSLFPIQETPIIDGIKELKPPPDPNGAQEDIDARNAENLATIKKNLKIQENEELKSDSPSHSGKVEAPYFEYTDNKIRGEKDMTQYIVTENEPFEVVPPGRDFNFPIGVPKIVPPAKFPYFLPDNGRKLEIFRQELDDEFGDKAMSTFETVMRKGMDNEDKMGIILVSIRSKRGADKSGLSIEVGMEVYYPIGECQKFTIAAVTLGPALTPVSVTLGGGPTAIPISDIELVLDRFQYGMNYRAYLLQMLYLSNNLGADDNSKEYYNPFKYRVTRIDVVNPSIDHSYHSALMTNFGIRPVWDELAYGPSMAMGQVDIKEYQIGRGPHSDNPTYIEITREPTWDGNSATILFEDDCDEGKIKLERLLDAPENLKDLVVAGPATFDFQKEKAPVTPCKQRFSHINTVHPPEESWLTHFDENTTESFEGLSQTVDFKYKQLPKSSKDKNSPYANGYFFGGWISLKFYLEEVSEWLKK